MICQVNMTVKNRGETSEIWFPFETDDVANLKELKDALIEDGMVHGTRYAVQSAGNGAKQVVDRYEFILCNTEAVTAISDLTFILIDPEAN